METWMNVLVRGGCGFLGSHIVDRLVTYGHKVMVIDDLSTAWLDDDQQAPKFWNPAAERYDGVMADQVDVLIHLGCRYPVEPEWHYWRHSFDGYVRQFVQQLDQLIPYRRLKKVIVGSTLEVYGIDGRGTFGSLAAGLRGLCQRWHKPGRGLAFEFIHLPELYGPRRVSASCLWSVPGSGQLELPEELRFRQLASVAEAAQLLSNRSIAPVRVSMDLVAVGHELSVGTVLPVEPDVRLTETDLGLGLEATYRWYDENL